VAAWGQTQRRKLHDRRGACTRLHKHAKFWETELDDAIKCCGEVSCVIREHRYASNSRDIDRRLIACPEFGTQEEGH